MELYDSLIKDRYYAKKRELKRLLNELQYADDIIQISHIHRDIDNVIDDLVLYKTRDVNQYRDERAKRNAFYMKASLLNPNREYIIGILNRESEEPDGKKA